MTRPTPADIALAARLLAHQRSASAGVEDPAAAARLAVVRVYERLAERLSPLIGVAGLRALLARSARLRVQEYPCLGTLSGPVDATLPSPSVVEQLGTGFGDLDAVQVSEAAAALYGTFLGLLTSFIGERLVGQVLQSAFPALDHDIGKETES